MNLQEILTRLQNCPCGEVHTFAIRAVEIGHGVADRAGAILREQGFGDRLLVVADANTMAAAAPLLPALTAAGFVLKHLTYPNLLCADADRVHEVEALCGDVDAILSVGTGSLNDICRVAAKTRAKPFAIFATAPSMDGFAADLAPIIENNFKTSWPGVQPDVILADTAILAAAPAELKAAGFGDMVAKYLGIFDWQVAHLLVDEKPYCTAVADLMLEAVEKMLALADRVPLCDEEAAGAIMESLVLSGLCMKLAASSRPASGAEHAMSHYWECYKIMRGVWPDFHGKKVGVASLIMTRVYRNLAERVEAIAPIADPVTVEQIHAAFDPAQYDEVDRINAIALTDAIPPERLRQAWPEIRRMALETLPDADWLLDRMNRAGCATDIAAVNVTPKLLEAGLRWHPFMKTRILLTRLLPMMNLDILDYID